MLWIRRMRLKMVEIEQMYAKKIVAHYDTPQ